MNPITRKIISKLYSYISERLAIETHVEWQHLRKPKIRDKCMAVRLRWTSSILIFGFFKASQLRCVTNFNILFLVIGFISLIDKIKFMLIRCRHFFA